jgi:hypothetical protein
VVPLHPGGQLRRFAPALHQEPEQLVRWGGRFAGGEDHAELLVEVRRRLLAEDRHLPAVETLRRVWVQNYRLHEGVARWRASEDIPPAAVFISSPYDGAPRHAA